MLHITLSMHTLATVIISMIAGLFCGILLYAGKRLSLLYNKPHLDIAFSVFRFLCYITFLYVVLHFIKTHSILLITLFLLSYISTIVIMVHKNNEKR